MAGGRKNTRNRASLSLHENFGREARRNIVTWRACGSAYVLHTWEAVVGHALSEKRANEFRSRQEARQLAALPGEVVLAAADSSMASDPNGHLLLSRWLNDALALALIRGQEDKTRLEEEDKLAREERRALRQTRRELEARQVATQRRAAQLRSEREAGSNPRDFT